MEELKIIGKYQTDSKHFKTPEEFNLYYVKHRDEMDNMTTQKLNKSFVIDGFRLTRIKGEICLKPMKTLNEPPPFERELEQTRNDVERLESHLNEMSAKIKLLTDTINEIIKTIQGD